jgi:cytochrome c oxidase subunit 6a
VLNLLIQGANFYFLLFGHVKSTAFRVAAQRARPMATSMGVRCTQRRGAQTVPRLGTEEQMKAEALEQIKARLAYQKELMKTKDPKHQLDEEIHEMYKWVKLSFMVGLPICLVSLIFSFTMEEHHHRAEGALPEYLAIRKKEFPWECGDCALFDLDCWKKCRAEKA